MKVLAIDPGYGRCGVAVLEKTASGERLILSDCIETMSGDVFTERLAAVAQHCIELIERERPDCMALEKLYFSKNQKTAMRVAEVRGALLQIATSRDLPVFEYGPSEIKSAVAGSGRADKKQVAAMVRLLVRVDKHIEYDDEYDAIALGLTHLARHKLHVVS